MENGQEEKKRHFFKVTYCCRPSWALQKECAMGQKKSCYMDVSWRKDAGIPPWTTTRVGGLGQFKRGFESRRKLIRS